MAIRLGNRELAEIENDRDLVKKIATADIIIAMDIHGPGQWCLWKRPHTEIQARGEPGSVLTFEFSSKPELRKCEDIVKRVKKLDVVRKHTSDGLEKRPLRHESLGPVLEKWLRKLYARVGKFRRSTFEQWEIDFLRAENPHPEMFVWEIIARTHEAYSEAHPDDDPRKTLGMLCAISKGFKIEDGDNRKVAGLPAIR